jgi:hypothetical protein
MHVFIRRWIRVWEVGMQPTPHSTQILADVAIFTFTWMVASSFVALGNDECDAEKRHPSPSPEILQAAASDQDRRISAIDDAERADGAGGAELRLWCRGCLVSRAETSSRLVAVNFRGRSTCDSQGIPPILPLLAKI